MVNVFTLLGQDLVRPVAGLSRRPELDGNASWVRILEGDPLHGCAIDIVLAFSARDRQSVLRGQDFKNVLPVRVSLI